MPEINYDEPGFCPICNDATRFVADKSWFRDYLFCQRCHSIPRERAIALAITAAAPHWRELRIHESSPCDRGISRRLAAECPAYLASQFFPASPFGQSHDGVRNENLENQTFASETFDIVLTQDVMEHVFHPDLVCKEVARTLSPGGHYIFTAPTYKERVETKQLAVQTDDGITISGAPIYHGNPVDPNGSLVTFFYGYDLPEKIKQWSGLDVSVTRYHDHHHGILGEHTEVYTCRKPNERR